MKLFLKMFLLCMITHVFLNISPKSLFKYPTNIYYVLSTVWGNGATDGALADTVPVYSQSLNKVTPNVR